MTYSVDKVRADFPVLSREVNGLPLAYLDSAASAQKPSQVIDAEAEFYRHGYAAVHRGIHTLSAQATEKMENVRKRASLFINARSAEELVFVRGTTEGSIWSPIAGVTAMCGRAITSSSVRWSTTLTLFLADALRTRWRRAACDPTQSRRYVATGDATYAV